MAKQTKPFEARGWLMAHVNHVGDECLIWPFFRDPGVGRGRVGWNGKVAWAHRVMCELAHGAAPEGKPTAAHTCGNGHLGCVHPGHLEWKSHKENCQDTIRHGTNHGPATGNRTRLTAEQVADIQSKVLTQSEYSKKYGVSMRCVLYWQQIGRPPAQYLKMKAA